MSPEHSDLKRPLECGEPGLEGEELQVCPKAGIRGHSHPQCQPVSEQRDHPVLSAPPPPVKSAKMKHRVGQKVHSGFSFTAYTKAQTDFEANAVHYVYNVCASRFHPLSTTSF